MLPVMTRHQGLACIGGFDVYAIENVVVGGEAKLSLVTEPSSAA
jgi:hypothetical protein